MGCALEFGARQNLQALSRRSFYIQVPSTKNRPVLGRGLSFGELQAKEASPGVDFCRQWVLGSSHPEGPRAFG